MTERKQNNINWLSCAMSLPIAYKDEGYFYSKELNLFSALGEKDYILLQEDFHTKYKTQYTDIEIKFIQSLYTRLITNQEDFAVIPRLSNDERIHIQMEFMATMHNHPDFNLIVDLITVQNDNATFILLTLFNKEPHLNSLIEPWSNYMADIMQSKVTEFAQQWNIDLTTAKLWDIEPSRRTIVEAPNQHPIIQEPVKKPFWKIW